MNEIVAKYQEAITLVMQDLSDFNIGKAQERLEALRHDLKRLKTSGK